MSTLYSIGQMNQLGDALEVEGFTPDEVTKLKQYSNLVGIKSILNGTAKIKPVSEDVTRIIINETTIAVNLGTAPKFPFDGAKVEQHIGEGWVIVAKRADGLYVDGRKVILYLSKRQKGDKGHGGHELREELSGKPVLNANLLDALLENLHLIPEDWKKDDNGNTSYIFFWASIYRHSHGHLYVRYVYFRDGGWCSDCYWLDGDWHSSHPAALLARN